MSHIKPCICVTCNGQGLVKCNSSWLVIVIHNSCVLVTCSICELIVTFTVEQFNGEVWLLLLDVEMKYQTKCNKIQQLVRVTPFPRHVFPVCFYDTNVTIKIK